MSPVRFQTDFPRLHHMCILWRGLITTYSLPLFISEPEGVGTGEYINSPKKILQTFLYLCVNLNVGLPVTTTVVYFKIIQWTEKSEMQ